MYVYIGVYLILCRKSKKKRQKDSQLEVQEFFIPLFQRLLSSDNPNTSDLDIPTVGELPSLTELCLSVVLLNALGRVCIPFTLSLIMCTYVYTYINMYPHTYVL